ncbi:MAG TPA: N-acetyltransferase [Lapidilactobacillus dextrinicus]|uniref:N-acetyltransferase n=1 Tax=Lapidilactobacillus dextrinicus TaxID=51664 RepID=A0A921B557_9LACO|nr:N-acetyltransferase [Lapidilactobacillus dextrinicus]HJE15663.1 N-acetyltransferase [Lapidilactobacillus dextrinicus]
MLVKYKQDYQKIALGLLSYTPDLKDFERLSAELQSYNSEDNLQLYLWKNHQGDFVGICGVELDDTFILLRHLAFTPDYRNQESQFAVLDALADTYTDKRIMAPMSMSDLLTSWEQHHSQEQRDED